MTRVDYSSAILVLSLLLFGSVPFAPFSAYAQQQSSPPSASSQPGGEQVFITVTVTDERNRVIGKLTKDRFVVLDGKIPQQVSFFEEKDVPLSVGFLLDFSGSMKTKLWNNERLKAMRDGISRFIQRSHQSNEYFILTFTDVSEVVTDWTRDRAAISEALNKLALKVQHGSTAFFDACYLGVEKLSRASNTKHVLILITDGTDTASRHTSSDLQKALRQSQAIVYSLFVEDSGLDPITEVGRGVLRRITLTTGGLPISASDSTGVPNALQMIAEQLRHQYTLGFKPASLDGKWHTLTIKLKPDEIEDASNPGKPRMVSIKAHTRQGYFAGLNR